MKKLKLSDTSLLRWFEESPYFSRMARVRFVHLRQFRLKVLVAQSRYVMEFGHLHVPGRVRDSRADVTFGVPCSTNFMSLRNASKNPLI